MIQDCGNRTCFVHGDGENHCELMSPTDNQLNQIQRDLNYVKSELAFIRETIVKADTTITSVAAQVMPTINELMSSPFVKMLGMGKK